MTVIYEEEIQDTYYIFKETQGTTSEPIEWVSVPCYLDPFDHLLHEKGD